MEGGTSAGQNFGCEISREGRTVAGHNSGCGGIRVECERRRIPDVRHPDKVERWPDGIPDVRHPGGMSAGEEFRM